MASNDKKREAHLLDAPLPFPTERIKLGDPLPDVEYDSYDTLL